VTHPIESRANRTQLSSVLRAAPLLPAGCLLALIHSGRVSAQEQQPPDEISVSAERQTALDNEALTISETPEAGPRTKHVSAIVGIGPLIGPAYDGSKKTKTSVFPYVDVRGLFDDRVFLSVVDGIGLKLLNDGPFRAGFTLNYAGGRTSKDDPHLTGMPDISGAAQVGGFLTYAIKPFAFEAKVRRRLGSTAGTTADLGASVGAAPLPQLHISLSADVSWADSSYQKTFFGVTAAEAATATAAGNPLTPYTPKSGLTSAAITAAAVYQLTDHLGLVVRVQGQDLIGKQAKDSPLVQRTFAPSTAFGVLYKF
jgi:outer membrane protein